MVDTECLMSTVVDEDTAAVPGNRVSSVNEGFDAAQAREAQQTPRRLRLVDTQPTFVDSSSGNRFSPLRDDDDVEADDSDSDESESLSVVDPEFAEEEVRADPELQVDRAHNFHAAFHSLEGVDVRSMFEMGAHVMKTVPGCTRGVLRGAFRLAIDEVLAGWTAGNVNRQERGWKLFFLIPRMLLYRPLRGGTVSRRKLQDRVDFFNRDCGSS